MRRLVAPLACLLLLASAPVGAGASAEGLPSGWRVVLTIDSARAGPQQPFEAFDTASLNLYDFDGDGQLEIVSNNDNNRVYVLDSKTGKVLSELTTFHYNNSKWPARELNPVAVGEVYGDGRPCLVVPNSASYLTTFCYDAAASNATSFRFQKMWEVRVDAALYEPDFKATHPWLYWENGTAKHKAGIDGHAYLADVTGDGKLEIFVETDSWPGQLAFSHDGKYLWSRSFADGNAGAVVVDIDKDGQKDSVFVSDGGLVSAYVAKTGGIKWVFDATKHNATPGSIPVAALVTDLHGDGKYETIFGARHAVQTNSPNWINDSHARYFALDHKGGVLWNVSYDWMNPLQYNHPAPADVNGDGVLDVVFLDWNTIGHYPGEWNTTNRQSNLFALDGRDGSALWHRGITVYWSNKDIVIMDVDGDGDQEIVAPTAKHPSEGLGVYDLKTGEPKGWFPAGDGWSMSRGPVAGDLYGDGKVHIVVPFNKKITDRPNYRSIDVGYREGKLVIIETGAAKSGLHFGANFLLNDEIDRGHKGTSGTPPTPKPTPTTPTGSTPTPTNPTSPPTPSPTPTPPTTPATTPSVPPTPSPTPGTPVSTPVTPPTDPRPTPPGPTPTSPTLGAESTVPAPGVAILAAALAGVAVLARRRR